MLKNLLILGLILPLGCGRPTAPEASHPKLIGSRISSDFPAVMAMHVRWPDAPAERLCTISLIHPKILLTAAHCVRDPKTGVEASSMTLFTGPNLNMAATRGQSWTINLQNRIKVHPNAQLDTLPARFDIARIELDQPLGISPLPVIDHRLATEEIATIDTYTLLGFGRSRSARSRVGFGRKAILEIKQAVQWTEQHIVVEDRSRVTCQGDSGGPLIAFIGGQPTIIGITSFGDPDCRHSSYIQRLDMTADFITTTRVAP